MYAADMTKGCTEADLEAIERGVALQDSGLRKDYAEAAEVYRSLAHRGCGEAMTRYAFLLREGLGIEQSDADAEYWEGRAAEVDALEAGEAEPSVEPAKAERPSEQERASGRLGVEDAARIDGLVFLGRGLVLQTFVPE